MRISGLFVLFIIILTASCKLIQPDEHHYPGTNKTDSSFVAESAKFEKVEKKVKLETAEVTPVNCFSKEVYDKNQVDCGIELAPVCGCNSITYNNECEAKKAGLKSYKKGRCPKEASGI
ncbi:MAG: hypothetical protein KDC49_19365 [Saprospiraceae bacterium]|nr:hypothetical protein [Saprospiraceae bacterium]